MCFLASSPTDSSSWPRSSFEAAKSNSSIVAEISLQSAKYCHGKKEFQ